MIERTNREAPLIVSLYGNRAYRVTVWEPGLSCHYIWEPGLSCHCMRARLIVSLYMGARLIVSLYENQAYPVIVWNQAYSVTVWEPGLFCHCMGTMQAYHCTVYLACCLIAEIVKLGIGLGTITML